MRLNLSSIGCTNSISDSIWSLSQFISFLMFFLYLLILNILSLFSLFSMLLIQAEGMHLWLWLLRGFIVWIVSLISNVQSLIEAGVEFCLFIVGWLLPQWRVFIRSSLFVVVERIGLNYVFLVGGCVSHLLSILTMIILSASFPFSILSIWWFPIFIGTNCSWSVNHLNVFTVICLFHVRIFIILWNRSIFEIELRVISLNLILIISWRSLILFSDVSFKSESCNKVVSIVNLLEFSDVLILSGKALIIPLLQEVVNCQDSVMRRIDRIIIWNLSVNVFWLDLIGSHAWLGSWNSFVISLMVTDLVHLTHFVILLFINNCLKINLVVKEMHFK